MADRPRDGLDSPTWQESYRIAPDTHRSWPCPLSFHPTGSLGFKTKLGPSLILPLDLVTGLGPSHCQLSPFCSPIKTDSGGYLQMHRVPGRSQGGNQLVIGRPGHRGGPRPVQVCAAWFQGMCPKACSTACGWDGTGGRAPTRAGSHGPLITVGHCGRAPGCTPWELGPGARVHEALTRGRRGSRREAERPLLCSRGCPIGRRLPPAIALWSPFATLQVSPGEARNVLESSLAHRLPLQRLQVEQGCGGQGPGLLLWSARCGKMLWPGSWRRESPCWDGPSPGLEALMSPLLGQRLRLSVRCWRQTQ